MTGSQEGGAIAFHIDTICTGVLGPSRACGGRLSTGTLAAVPSLLSLELYNIVSPPSTVAALSCPPSTGA